MGRIAGLKAFPSSKFVFPENFSSTLEEKTTFTIKMAIKNIVTGNFVNPNSNYYAAPQQVNDAGQIIGHSHVTVETMPSFTATDPLDPTVFAFFKGLNAAAAGGVLSVAVDGGLPAGFYRMCSINAAANHQPVLVARAQHGSLDDCTYFQIKAKGQGAAPPPASGGNNNANGACKKDVTVQPKDTCDLIARVSGVDEGTLRGLNPQINANCNNLQPGQKLCVSK